MNKHFNKLVRQAVRTSTFKKLTACYMFFPSTVSSSPPEVWTMCREWAAAFKTAIFFIVSWLDIRAINKCRKHLHQVLRQERKSLDWLSRFPCPFLLLPPHMVSMSPLAFSSTQAPFYQRTTIRQEWGSFVPSPKQKKTQNLQDAITHFYKLFSHVNINCNLLLLQS